MMFREAKLVALAVFHTLLLAICVVNGNQICRPSSCGDIQNISYPFRLKGDPSECGDPEYELVCENNHTMVNLEYGKYYVADINYDNYTIRVVDPGVEKGNCFSTPLYSLSGIFNFYQSAYYWNLNEEINTTVLMNCEQPISDGNYIPSTPCNSSSVTSSSSQAHVYALVGGGYTLLVNDIKYSCTILSTIVTRFMKPGNLSMSDLQEMLLLGVDFSFLSFRCKSKCGKKWPPCSPDFAKNTVICGKYEKCLFLFIYLIILLATKRLFNLVTNMTCLIGLMLQGTGLWIGSLTFCNLQGVRLWESSQVFIFHFLFPDKFRLLLP